MCHSKTHHLEHPVLLFKLLELLARFGGIHFDGQELPKPKHDHHINSSTSICPEVPTPNENKQNKQIARQQQIPILRVWS